MATYNTKKISELDSITDYKSLTSDYNLIVSKSNADTKIATIKVVANKLSNDLGIINIKNDIVELQQELPTIELSIHKNNLCIRDLSDCLDTKTDLTTFTNLCTEHDVTRNMLTNLSSSALPVSACGLIRTDYVTDGNKYAVNIDAERKAYVEISGASGSGVQLSDLTIRDARINILSNSIFGYDLNGDPQVKVCEQLSTLSSLHNTNKNLITDNSTNIDLLDSNLILFRLKAYGSEAFRQLTVSIIDTDVWTEFITTILTGYDAYKITYNSDAAEEVRWKIVHDDSLISACPSLESIGLTWSSDNGTIFSNNDHIELTKGEDSSWTYQLYTYANIGGDIGKLSTDLYELSGSSILSINNITATTNKVDIYTKDISTEVKSEYDIFSGQSIIQSLMKLSSMISELSSKIENN